MNFDVSLFLFECHIKIVHDIPVVFDEYIDSQLFNHSFLEMVGLLVVFVMVGSDKMFLCIKSEKPLFEVIAQEIISSGYDISLYFFFPLPIVSLFRIPGQ